MPAAVSIDGVLVPAGQARVPVLDRGFLYGDSVYEVVRTYGLEPFEVGAHLARLVASASRIGLELPWDARRLEAEIRRVVQASRGEDPPEPDAAPWNRGERTIRVVVTRGSGEMGLDPALATAPLVVVLVLPLLGPAASAYREGVAAWPVGARRGGDPAAKTGEHLFHVLSVREAARHQAHEALLVDGQGCVTEGASSNVFAVEGGVLVTPPLQVGILAGVTRALVIDIARAAQVPVREEPLPLPALLRADEAFLTSTARELLPLTRVGEGTVGSGAPGPVTRRLHQAFREFASGATS